MTFGGNAPDYFGEPRWQPHLHSGLATLPSMGAVP